MEKYFIGICIVVASLIYVWGNRWEVSTIYNSNRPMKYNKITGKAYRAVIERENGKEYEIWRPFAREEND